MSTPYSTTNQLFSDQGHLAAQRLIYPALFNVSQEQLSFITTSLSVGDKEKILDGEMAVDRLVRVQVQWFREKIEFTVQERFRRIKFAPYRDITITEWNNRTNLKSELYKLNAGIFVYGYFDEKAVSFQGWIAFDTTHLLFKLVSSAQPIKRQMNPRSQQTFITFTFETLKKLGVVLGMKG
jgi:hypothetical protein